MRRLLLVLPLLLPVPVGAQEEEPEFITIELGDDTTVVGVVVEDECTDEALVVRQLQGDAKRVIPWDQIKEQQAHDLRVELGFEVAEAAQGALMIQGHEIRNKAGVTFRGLLTNAKTAKADGVYVLKTSEGERRIPATDIQSGPNPIDISRVDVYTSKELYQQKLDEVQGRATKEGRDLSAEDHYNLAEFALLVDALEEAKTHYEAAIAGNDPKYTREKLERRLVQVTRLLEQSGARASLKEIQRALFEHKFDKAASLLAAFKEKYGADATLAKTVLYLEEKSKNDRAEYFTTIVPTKLREAVKDEIERKLKEDKDLTLNTAKQFAGGEPASDGSAGNLALAAVGKELGIDAAEVLTFWAARKRTTMFKGFYRDGTFLVVENLEDALAKAPKPPKPQPGKEAPKLPTPTKPMTPDDWWKGKVESKKFTDLRDWLYAWWAEKSGMCDVVEPKDEPCQTCYGKGYTQMMVVTPQGSLPYYNRCQTCYMAKFQRVVRFK